MAKLNWKAPAPFAPTPLSIARGYISQGIEVFPCREVAEESVDPSTGELVEWPEKSPYTVNGLKGASRSPRIIDILFGDRHPTACIGVPTGENLGAWVLDIDQHGDRNGHTWLAEMEELHGAMPETARATTANGGLHIFFRHVDGVRNRAAIAPGVDTRGQGGYVLGPGSVMADGRSYKWVDHEGDRLPAFAAAPQWLLDLVIGPRASQPAPPSVYTYTPGGAHDAYVERALEAEVAILSRASVGERGSQVNKSAFCLGQLVGAGVLARTVAETELLAAAVACGVVAKDGEREIRAKIRRGLNSGEKQPRQMPEAFHQNDNTPGSATLVRRLLENHRSMRPPPDDKDENDSNTPIAEASTDQSDAESAKKERFELTWFDDIEEGTPKETIIRGTLGEGEFTTISGLPGTGKSVIVTDMACHIAAGREWHGRKVKQGLVVYVAAERKKLTERRMMAFRKEHGVKDVPLLVIGGRLDFTKDLRDANDLIRVIREAETITGQKCVWVIIDTLTRVFGAGDQNASKDMTRFVQACDQILAELKTHVTAIHHSAWSGERGKGAIDLDGAVDASFMVKKNGSTYKLVCDGTNDGEDGDIISFRMKSVELGHDEDGEPTTAPVVVRVPDAVSGSNLVASRTWSDRALAVLVEMEPDGDDATGAHGFPETGKIVSTDAWRQAFYDLMGDATQQTKQTTFKRCEKALLKSGEIVQLGQFTWVSR